MNTLLMMVMITMMMMMMMIIIIMITVIFECLSLIALSALKKHKWGGGTGNNKKRITQMFV